jgi:hypothetical protein
MSDLLGKLAREYSKSGFKPKTNEARAWFLGRIQGFDNITARTLMKEEDRLTPHAMIGGMFFFFYDAKWKDELPYWDKFPLIIPVDFYKDRFHGLNLHYLDPWSRAKLLDKMMQISGDKRIDAYGKLRLTYNMIKNAKRYREIKPCYKEYLYPNVRSKFLKVEPNEYEVAIFLPVQQFQKASASEVWSDSFFQGNS